MPRLICVLAGRTDHFVGFVMRQLISCLFKTNWGMQCTFNSFKHCFGYNQSIMVFQCLRENYIHVYIHIYICSLLHDIYLFSCFCFITKLLIWEITGFWEIFNVLDDALSIKNSIIFLYTKHYWEHNNSANVAVFDNWATIDSATTTQWL